MDKWRSGIEAGTAATLAHSLVMFTLHELLPNARREPVPPRQITSDLARRAGATRARREPLLSALTTALHFGYGAAAGALYAPIGEQVRDRPIAGGVTYGLVVWAASYLGWIPAVRILPPATRHPTARNVMMVAAHAAWGAALGAVFNARRRAIAPARRTADSGFGDLDR